MKENHRLVFPRELKSEKTGALLRNNSRDQEKAVLVCSEKLTSENWEEIRNEHILMIQLDLEVKETIL